MKNMQKKNRSNGILLVSFLFLFVILSVSVSAFTINLNNIFSQMTQTIQEDQAEGCDNQLQHCYDKEGADKQNIDAKDVEPKKVLGKREKNGEDVPCNFTDSSSPNQCNGNEPCFCYDYNQRGDCTEGTSSCNAIAVTKEGWSLCKCGDGETTIEGSKEYCSDKLGKVYATEIECVEAEAFSLACGAETPPVGGQDLCVSPDTNRPNACIGLSCGGGYGICGRGNDGEIKCLSQSGVNKCSGIENAQCINVMRNGGYSGSRETHFYNDGGPNGGLLECFNANNRLTGKFRFPNNREIKVWNADIKAEGDDYWSDFDKKNLKEIINDIPTTSISFEEKWRDEIFFREYLCGADAKRSYGDAKWGTQCCVYIPPACDQGLFNEDFFGPIDPHTTMAMDWIESKTNLLTVSEKQKKKLDKMFTPKEGTLIDEYSDLESKWCEADIRRDLSADDLAAIPEKKDLGNLSLTIVGKFSAPLPDDTKLYKLSWVIHNKPGSGNDMLFVVYANKLDGGWDTAHFAKKDGNEMKDVILTPGKSSLGVYSFYSDTSLVNGCITYIDNYNQETDEGEINEYCQGFKDETYNDIAGNTETTDVVSEEQDRGWRD